MLDIKKIRENAAEIEKQLKTKDPEISLKEILALDERIRHLKTEIEEKRAHLNKSSKEIGEMKRRGEDASSLMSAIASLGDEITVINHELTAIEADFNDKMAYLPNIPDSDIKISLDPKDNVCIKSWGKKPEFSFSPKNHLELNETLNVLDFKRGAKITGSGWPVYTNMGARLEWALINYMIETHLKNGFELTLVPHLVKEETMYGSAQIPKFRNQFFKLDDADYPFILIPTGEVSLNGLYSDEIFAEEELPKKLISYTPCFRREAGAAGSNERGLIRVHQFNKVEMFCFAKPDESEAVFEMMLASAEEVLQGLNIHYRNMLLVTGDMSFSAKRTVDIEVYLPGQERYYEVSSVSNCSDFQARRSKTRFRKGQDKPELVHTLNGSGTATARLLVAILENNQDERGRVAIPEVLRPYLGGVTHLE